MSVLKNVSRRSPRSSYASIFFATLFALNLTTALAGFGCARSTDSEPLAAEATKPALRVATSGDYAPFSIRETGGSGSTAQASGFSVAIAAAYAEATEREITWVDFSWPSLARDLAAERFDLALSGVTVRPDRSILGRFSLPLTISGAVALVPDDPQEGSAQTLEDLSRAGLGIAVNAGGHLERTARALFPQARIVPISNNANVLPALDRDGISAVITDTLEAPHWQSQRPGLRAIGPLTRDRKAAWFPPSRASEARRFDAWLLHAEADGTLSMLRERHGLPAERTADRMTALVASLDERLSLMIEVARAKQVLGSPIEDLGREARVLTAAALGIDRAALRHAAEAPSPAAVRAFYVSQMEAAKSIQRAWTRNTAALSPDAQSDEARARAQASLDQEIRPALIFLGDRIARLVVRALKAGDPAPTQAGLATALARHDLPEDRIDALASAMAALFARTSDATEPDASR